MLEGFLEGLVLVKPGRQICTAMDRGGNCTKYEVPEHPNKKRDDTIPSFARWREGFEEDWVSSRPRVERCATYPRIEAVAHPVVSFLGRAASSVVTLATLPRTARPSSVSATTAVSPATSRRRVRRPAPSPPSSATHAEVSATSRPSAPACACKAAIRSATCVVPSLRLVFCKLTGFLLRVDRTAAASDTLPASALMERASVAEQALPPARSPRARPEHVDAPTCEMLPLRRPQSYGEVTIISCKRRPAPDAICFRDCLAAPGTADVGLNGIAPANLNKNKTCYKCQQEGHIARDCPENAEYAA
ncbi:hypothetical protein EVG20_g7391 [Dentipellis fragilis]|uniref:CCHC-type domain-containing protein n=1 Tax=Dentipellis fragilis TaxID=205917 RepID=A0A4Y9YF79_9AGAM|nr:hypothetical protein EVG20_g7391 [Dentipellis fragilis]